MKIIIAIDSFKGSLTSTEAGEAAKEGILQIHPEWQIDIIPIADGGEGMLSVMLNATQGTTHTLWAHNPCMELTPAEYGISNDGKTAFIEMAAISGLPLIREEQRNPMRTTTYGTGELIRDALEKGCARFQLGVQECYHATAHSSGSTASCYVCYVLARLFLYDLCKVSHTFVQFFNHSVVRTLLTSVYMSGSVGAIKRVLYIASYDEMGIFEQRVYFLCTDVVHFP